MMVASPAAMRNDRSWLAMVVARDSARHISQLSILGSLTAEFRYQESRPDDLVALVKP
jgi:hypothetical protein